MPPVYLAICSISSGRTEASDSSGPTARTATASSPFPRSVSPFFAVATSLYGPGAGGANSSRTTPSGPVCPVCTATGFCVSTETSSTRTCASCAGW